MTMTMGLRQGAELKIYITFTDQQVGVDRIPITSILPLQPRGVAVPNSRLQ
jgi:hypothetical protein